MAEHDDDRQRFLRLMKALRNGDQDAAAELVAVYGDYLRLAVRRALNRNSRLRSKFDSTDFVQSVWKSFFCTPHPARDFDDPARLAAFLLAIARRKVDAEVRKWLISEKYNVNRERPLEDLGNDECHAQRRQEPLPIDVAIAKERVRQFVADLRQRRDRIMLLRKLRGQSSSSIATELHVDESTVRRFLRKLWLKIRGR
jgi:RNA polymerase sigma factor (sigma-70 family)